MTTTPTTPTTTAPRGAEPVLDEAVLRATLTATRRPSPPSPLAASFAFCWRAMLKIKHVPFQLFDVTAFPIMFTLLFTYLFGGALAGSPKEYLQFLIPGIVVQTVAMITMYTGMAVRTDISKGSFDRFRSLPIWRPSVLVGMLMADSARYSVASAVIIVLGVILGFRPQGGPLGVVAAVVLVLVFAFALSWLWTAVAFKLQTPDAVMQMSMTVLFPLVFASNIFVNPDTMPGWVQAFVEVNPVTHLTTASRTLMHGTVDTEAIVWSLGWSAALVLVFAPLTMRFFGRET
jgi:ABC-2 type transport system permease protein